MAPQQSIVQISDTHFGTDVSLVKEELIKAINRINPSVLIWSGDITQRARSNQFKAAKAFLDQLDYDHLVCVPGNHDIPLFNLAARLFRPYQNYQRHFSPQFAATEPVTSYQTDGIGIVSLNSCNLMHYKNGQFSKETTEEVKQRLLAMDQSQLKLVVAHHPVDAILESDEENIVPNAKQALQHWTAAGMDLIMGGHIHFQFTRSLRHRYPSLETEARVIQAGTAMSSRTRSGMANSFVRLQLGESKEATELEFWDFNKQSGFSAVDKQLLFAAP